MTISAIAKQDMPQIIEQITLKQICTHITEKQVVILGVWRHESFKRTWAYFASKYSQVLGLETKATSKEEGERRQQVANKFRMVIKEVEDVCHICKYDVKEFVARCLYLLDFDIHECLGHTPPSLQPSDEAVKSTTKNTRVEDTVAVSTNLTHRQMSEDNLDQEPVEVADSQTYWYKRLDQRLAHLSVEVSKGFEAVVDAIKQHKKCMENVAAEAAETFGLRANLGRYDSDDNLDGGVQVESTYSESDDDKMSGIPPDVGATCTTHQHEEEQIKDLREERSRRSTKRSLPAVKSKAKAKANKRARASK